ncbi:relaxase/mobilization nuclease domain-containing protein [Mucilaginibacter sp. 21P]|uniref:relaxase/mobilization nuclease domain-containing protein n=1 Tax=Mucilaginibacter sp. 21P TaxID=2778902 RepID=UPI001C575B5E|nr:relaxase/mobilization nuclease domain-containing protein [Mucilaginibacter sp. 21P]QXV65569.1 relaxase/mobilization nuclease domain-containing protein [Mucilaginibacter sp. 21P]
MTADQVKGKGFRCALLYNLEKVNKGVATVLDSSFSEMKVHQVMREIAMVKALRPNLQKYFYHTSINFPPEEKLTGEEKKNIALEYLAEMGFASNQYAVFEHFDAEHPHVHLLVNRIAYDGSVVSDSRDYARSEAVLRKLEKKHGLRQVASSRQAQERAVTKNELEMMQRTGEPSVKVKLQVIIKDTLKYFSNDSKASTKDFIEALERKGVSMLFNQASTGFVSGISYTYDGKIFKGAALGNAYKWSSIRSMIAYEQERDGTSIRQANDRARRSIEARTRGHADRSAGRGQGFAQTNAGDAADGKTKIWGGADLTHPFAAGAAGQARAEGVRDRSMSKPANGTLRASQRTAKVWEPLAYQAVPYRNIGRVLLCTDRDDLPAIAEDVTDAAYLKRKKKRKGLRM